jgi:hypothetical protein
VKQDKLDESPEQSAARAAAARSGDLETLANLTEHDECAAYRWLLVACDAGHEEAGERLADLDEHVDCFRYDDDRLLRAEIELEVATLYFRGDVVPLDLAKARRHLHEYLDVATLGFDGWSPSDLDPLRDEVPEASRAELDAILANEPFRAVSHRVERIKRLHELNQQGAGVPVVVLEHELQQLREAVSKLAGLVVPGGRAR